MRIIGLCLIMTLLQAPLQAAELSVFAASSLTEGLRKTVKAYQRQYPTETVRLYLAGSQSLATQIEQGAPADLFISANLMAMERLKNSGLIDKPKGFLENRLILAFQPDLVPKPESVKDLVRPNLLLSIGTPQVPVGNYTRQLFAHLAADPGFGHELIAQIKQNIVSEENRVKAIIAKLLLGEIDAGIVYKTDLDASNAQYLYAVKLPQLHNPRVEYLLARVKDSQTDARPFIHFLLTSKTQQIFADQGFLTGLEP